MLSVDAQLNRHIPGIPGTPHRIPTGRTGQATVTVARVNVEVTPLPGIGTRQDFEVRAGRRIGVVNHRDGKIELLVSKVDDPDACTAEIPLTPDEAGALASLLGAAQLVASLHDETKDLAGVTTRQLPIIPRSPYDGPTLGDTARDAYQERGSDRRSSQGRHRAPLSETGLHLRRW